MRRIGRRECEGGKGKENRMWREKRRRGSENIGKTI